MSSKPAEMILNINQLRFAWQKDAPVMSVDNLQVARGERVFLQGVSGSGKSTLLSLIGGVAVAQAGELSVLGQDLTGMSAKQRDRFRAEHLGLIFQQFNLIPYLSGLENVLLTGRFSKARSVTETQAKQLLSELGIDEALAKSPVTALSIGQQQRVAAARALAGNPELIIADEPTSALDADTRDSYLALLFEQCQTHGSSLLFVSHDQSLASRFDRTVKVAEIIQWSDDRDTQSRELKATAEVTQA
ncbi:ABC transporter ATP-binding protein [Litoribacillus peritrichatus]|uniref:ABC transporter ATP-binding protein n=1 Tax=Litoribacillus peritrichatus TaxID=718191 RepID=A0ABP7MPD4_9GAMM